MAVRFDEIVFQNDNGIEVTLTIEAPVGQTIVREHRVLGHATYRVQPGITDCASALFVARAADHSENRQTFTLAANPEQAYFTRLSARYVIGSIDGSISARTERG